MRVFENEKFDHFVDHNSAAAFADIEFHRCQFEFCSVSITHEPELRSTVSNVRLANCTVNGGTIDRAIIEDCLVENLKTPGLFQTFGTVFKHVVLRGKFERMMLNNNTLPRGDLNPPYDYESVEAFRAANAEYYRHVDWALDISQGQFRSLDVRGIPCRLIRRDPETQVVVTKKRLLESDDWREMAFDGPAQVIFQILLDGPYEDALVVAPKRHRKFPLYMADVQLLRDAGIAEPD